MTNGRPSHERRAADHHLHADRRGAAACDLRLSADHPDLHRAGGDQRRNQRHLGGGSHPGRVLGLPVRGPAGARQPRQPRRAHASAGDQHHQAAEHQCFGAAAHGRHQGTAGEGVRSSRLSGAAEDRRGEETQGALRQGSGQRGESDSARGQFGPSRPQGGQGVRAQAPAQHGRVFPGVAHPRGDHEGRGLLPRGEVDDPGPGSRRADGAEDEAGRDDRAQARDVAERRRRHREHVHEQEGLGASSTKSRSRMRTRPA